MHFLPLRDSNSWLEVAMLRSCRDNVVEERARFSKVKKLRGFGSEQPEVEEEQASPKAISLSSKMRKYRRQPPD
eukprot:5552945-Amphidinium_carterae.1